MLSGPHILGWQRARLKRSERRALPALRVSRAAYATARQFALGGLIRVFGACVLLLLRLMHGLTLAWPLAGRCKKQTKKERLYEFTVMRVEKQSYNFVFVQFEKFFRLLHRMPKCIALQE